MNRFVFIISALYFFAGCHQPVTHQDHTTTVFAYYLGHAFHDSIRQEPQTYILIPKLGCKGCREEELRILHRYVLHSGKTGLTYIISPSVSFEDSLAAPGKLWRDKSGLIDKIDLPVSNIAIVRTGQGRVESLVSVLGERMDSIPFYLGK